MKTSPFVHKPSSPFLPTLFFLLSAAVLAFLFWRFVSLQAHHTPTAPLRPLSTTERINLHAERMDSLLTLPRRPLQRYDNTGEEIYTPIRPLPQSFSQIFADDNKIQWETASRLGIPACANRNEVERYQSTLVHIDETPLYYVNELTHSMPYLVPRAARLLERIAQNFQDSLTMKGEEKHQLIVTSILRTETDIQGLSRNNRNASTQSCHLFGTTFDISYTNFLRPTNEQGLRGEVGDPYALKLILGEVLRDLRDLGTCYVKYEVKQACFHITAR